MIKRESRFHFDVAIVLEPKRKNFCTRAQPARVLAAMPHHAGDYQPELVIGRGERMILCEAESQSNIPDKNLEEVI